MRSGDVGRRGAFKGDDGWRDGVSIVFSLAWKMM
jgi:hypothetical protein